MQRNVPTMITEWRTHLPQASLASQNENRRIYIFPLHAERTYVREGKEPFQLKQTMIMLAQNHKGINWPRINSRWNLQEGF